MSKINNLWWLFLLLSSISMFVNPFIGFMGLFLAITLFIELIFYLNITVRHNKLNNMSRDDKFYNMINFQMNGAIKTGVPLVIFIGLVAVVFVGGSLTFIIKYTVFAFANYLNNQIVAIICYMFTIVFFLIGSWGLIKKTKSFIIK